MSMNRHEPFEELISASLRNDITPDERARLDQHLDSCAQCRDTLAAFSDQRRIVAGMRHQVPPRDLDARVRAGIEAGRHGSLPWWRRPQLLFAGVGGAALVAGALFAIVLLNGPETSPPTGQATPTQSSAPDPSASALPTLPPPPSVPPSGEPSQAPAESIDPSPSEEPVPASPEPELFLALTRDVEAPAVTIHDGTTGEVVTEAEATSGELIAAELSPDGQWLAYISVVGESGMHEVRATRVATGDDDEAPIGETVTLGTGVSGSPFLERMAWSEDSRYLGYTLATPDEGTDAWVFEPEEERSWQRTDVGNAYAGSWVTGRGGSPVLWVSVAGPEPESYLMTPTVDGRAIATDPQEGEFGPATNVFQPMVSPNGAYLMYWTGRMEQTGDEWLFSQAGTPWLAENHGDGAGGYEFTSVRPVFSDVTIGREAFASAAITWGGDSDAYAVWDTDWMGVPQTDEGRYPDRERIYFGHATDPRGLTQVHAIDEGDLPTDAFVVDVKVSPTGRHLVITAGQPRAGVLDPPRADLLLVERNTGDVADVVTPIGSAEDGWFGPAAFGDAR